MKTHAFYTYWQLTSLLACVMLSQTAIADETILDDLIVNGSACIGEECTDGQVFGFDSLQITGDNPSILFHDTSSSASFPTNDWRMGTSNTSESSVFYIEDVDAGAMALQIEAGDDGGVAIGVGSTLESGAVSVGSAGNERKITNVAAGVNDTDAVNMAQFNAFVADINDQVSSTSYEIDFADIKARQDQIDYRLDSLATEIDAVTATAAALSAVQANPRSTGKTQLGVGLGNYRGEGAIAVGVYRFSHSDQVMYNAGVATHTNGGGVASRAGVSFGW